MMGHANRSGPTSILIFTRTAGTERGTERAVGGLGVASDGADRWSGGLNLDFGKRVMLGEGRI